MSLENVSPAVLLFQGITVNSPPLGDKVLDTLKNLYGPILYCSSPLPFSKHTSYYEKEMGSDLYKLFVFFENNIDLEDFYKYKKESNLLERDYVIKGKRQVNIDPGALSLFNFSLLSTKGFSHRIYLKDGIFSELTLYVHKGTFKALPWTYPDYLENEVLALLEKSRQYLKQKVKNEKI